MNKRLPILLAALFLPPSAAWARNAVGITSANFLKLGVSPRAVAMGEAFTAVSDDVNALYYNPAGLGTLERQELTLMYNRFVNDVTQQWGAYALPTKRFGTLALGFNMLRVEPFQAFTNNDVAIGTVDASDIAAVVGYGKEVGNLKRVSLGMSAKYISSKLASYRTSAVAFDAGALARYGRQGVYETQWRLGGGVRNMGPSMKFIDEGFPLPQSAHIGVARMAPLPHPFEDIRYILSTEAAWPNDGLPYFNTGLEVRLVRELAIRVGYRTNQKAGLGVSAGLGFTSLNKGFTVAWFPEISMDYAFVSMGGLAQAHRLSFSIRFGYNKNAKIEYESLFEPAQ